jgi:hypothetical protein
MASPRQILHNYVEDTYKIKFNVLGSHVAIGIRGAVPDDDGDIIPTKNEHNKYDDTLGWFTADARFLTKGTVEPGKKYTDQPMNKDGAFYLKKGLYVMIRAKHFGMPAFNLQRKYPKGVLEGYRDSLRLGRNPIDIDPKAKIRTDATGIDVHAGGNDINNIAGWSAGCQVVLGDWHSPAWLDFKNPLYASKQTEFLYCLLNYADIKTALES